MPRSSPLFCCCLAVSPQPVWLSIGRDSFAFFAVDRTHTFIVHLPSSVHSSLSTKQKKEPHQSVAAATEAAASIQILGYLLLPCASQTFTDVPAIRIRWTIILALQLSDVLDIRI